ncbi:MAG: Hpt domain-containing protein [Acidaminococcaceae bacterium]|nr:Hpt domain-containing protein [Acidaminococcaceae bacterium]
METLKEYGVKTNQGLERCCNMEAFYFKMVTASVNDANFEKLGKALEAHDLKEAFEAAHALKGIAGNLALDPLYDAVCEIVEPLRAGEDKDYTEGYKKVLEARDRLAALI